jgi:hypothetical protein
MEGPTMTGFTITITPNDDPGAQTSIHVETAVGSARITELTVRAADGGTLSPDQLAAVNLDALVAAVAPATMSAARDEPAGSVEGGPVAAPPAGRPESTESTGSTAATPATASTASVASNPTRGRSKSVERRTAGRKVSHVASEQSNGRRAYRRMPEVREVLDAYRQVGGTTALARHYGVPRHTATGWLRRLRSMGELES